MYENIARDEGAAYQNMSCRRRQWYVDDQLYCKHDSPSVCLLPLRSEVQDVVVPAIGHCGDLGGSERVVVVCERLNLELEHADTAGGCGAADLIDRGVWCKLYMS